MGRKQAVVVLLAGALMMGVLAGCGDTTSPQINEPYKASEPPKDWLEQRKKARESAPAPGPGQTAPGQPGSAGR